MFKSMMHLVLAELHRVISLLTLHFSRVNTHKIQNVADSEVLRKQYNTTERWGSNGEDTVYCSLYNSDITSIREVGINFEAVCYEFSP